MKKIISIVLALLLSLSCFSVMSFAEETDTPEHITEVPEGYTGIYTKEDLDNIRIAPEGKYILMNNLTFEEADYQKGGDFYNGGKGWEPIATTYSPSIFTGTFDGNGYSISNLYISNPSSDYKGLFGLARGATIKNLTLKNVDISGKDRIGGICGNITSTTISNCIVTGKISGQQYVGGICGYSEGRSTLSYCSVAGEVSGNRYVGGICGEQYSGSNNIDYCCNSASVTATSECVGGITGRSYYSNNIISNSMNCGKISGKQFVGGICGGFSDSISYCISTGEVSGSSDVGGIIGYYDGSITKCYYLEEAAVNPTYIRGIAKSEDQLKKRATFEGWDFDTVWTMDGRADYPYPELQNVPLIFAEDFNHKHEYTSEVTTEPTHLTEGVMTFTCACGDSYTEAIPKTAEHTYVSEVTTEPTHLTEGVMTYTCACGDSYTEAIAKTAEHTYVSEVTTEPTHLTEGVMTFTCACGDSYTEAIAKTTEHTYVSEVTTEPTHLTEGVMTFTCACGDSYTEAIPKTAEHTYTAVKTAPTCTEKGYTTYTCACGDSYVGDYVEATGHSDVNKDGKCDFCGKDLTENCSCRCHKSGFDGFIWKIVNLFNRLFKINKVCACGKAHY